MITSVGVVSCEFSCVNELEISGVFQDSFVVYERSDRSYGVCVQSLVPTQQPMGERQRGGRARCA